MRHESDAAQNLQKANSDAMEPCYNGQTFKLSLSHFKGTSVGLNSNQVVNFDANKRFKGAINF